jgi:hypothetical protein
MNFVEAMTAAQAGFDTWAAKPHNKKWAKMIYHTPIPNDLLVNIAEAFCDALASQPAGEGGVAPACGLASPSYHDCPNMKEVGGGFEGERYRCAACGKGYFLDYEDMK